MKDYPLAPHMIQAKVKPIPSHLWKYGMEHLTGHLREINDNKLKMNLLPVGGASVRPPEGIYFQGLYYTCERAIRERWFERIKGKRVRSLKVASEALVDRIHLRFDHGRLFETCQLTPACKRFAGKDWYEVREYFSWLKQQEKEVVPITQQSTAEFHAQMKRLISSETKATEDAIKHAGISKRARAQGIRANRNQVKEHERKHGTLSFNSSSPDLALPDHSHIEEINKQMRRPASTEDYVSPAQPLDEIRAARERARKKDE